VQLGNPIRENTMFEAIVIAFIAVAAQGTVVETFGPHQEPAAKERVAVKNDKGEVLYYNVK
jgi:hypothetical protein